MVRNEAVIELAPRDHHIFPHTSRHDLVIASSNMANNVAIGTLASGTHMKISDRTFEIRSDSNAFFVASAGGVTIQTQLCFGTDKKRRICLVDDGNFAMLTPGRCVGINTTKPGYDLDVPYGTINARFIYENGKPLSDTICENRIKPILSVLSNQVHAFAKTLHEEIFSTSATLTQSIAVRATQLEFLENRILRLEDKIDAHMYRLENKIKAVEEKSARLAESKYVVCLQEELKTLTDSIGQRVTQLETTPALTTEPVTVVKSAKKEKKTEQLDSTACIENTLKRMENALIARIDDQGRDFRALIMRYSQTNTELMQKEVEQSHRSLIDHVAYQEKQIRTELSDSLHHMKKQIRTELSDSLHQVKASVDQSLQQSTTQVRPNSAKKSKPISSKSISKLHQKPSVDVPDSNTNILVQYANNKGQLAFEVRDALYCPPYAVYPTLVHSPSKYGLGLWSGDNKAPLVFYTGSKIGYPIERFRITNKGYLGIGTTTPKYTTDVKGQVNAKEYFEDNVKLSAKYAQVRDVCNQYATKSELASLESRFMSQIISSISKQHQTNQLRFTK
jgi:hypothetical protein